MLLKEVLEWLEDEFEYPVPQDYLDFLKQGDFESSWRKYYVIETQNESLEVSDWFDYENLKLAYDSCLDEEIIEKYYLPIFDSCGMTVIIDCNNMGETYGQIFVSSTNEIYDTEIDEAFEFVAEDFSELISNLKTEEEIEELGIW